MKEKIEDSFIRIVAHWNKFKGGKSQTKLDRRGNPIQWHSCTKINQPTKLAITEALKYNTIDDICSAIDNYALVLLSDDYYWGHVWSISTFLTVKHGSGKKNTDLYKWWQFLPEEFNDGGFLSWNKQTPKESIKESEEELPDDPDPVLTDMFVKSYRFFSGRQYQPNIKDKISFIRATIQAYKRCSNSNYEQKEILVANIYDILEETYRSKGGTVQPGHYCSDYSWTKLFPQYFIATDVVNDVFFNIAGI